MPVEVWEFRGEIDPAADPAVASVGGGYLWSITRARPGAELRTVLAWGEAETIALAQDAIALATAETIPPGMFPRVGDPRLETEWHTRGRLLQAVAYRSWEGA